ncbi:unnamed protein product [Rhizoctonia solani]|uniref:Uncharacterized protein n=1 Tax=Rhizoctonia solani TaxID=456999 RepID=A0A8H2XUA3_9AGAM|nr:unnamed protein product [Rhizoctonia solani]CAE6485228.1 unnamed protein product [Rhizoctonia solani]
MATNEVRLYYKEFGQAVLAATRFAITPYAPNKNPKRDLKQQIIWALEERNGRTHPEVPSDEITKALNGRVLQKYISTSDHPDVKNKFIGLAVPEQEYFLRIDYKPVPGYDDYKRPANPTLPAEKKKRASFEKIVAGGGFGIHFNARYLGKIPPPRGDDYPPLGAFVTIGDQYPTELKAKFDEYLGPLQKNTLSVQAILNYWRRGVPVPQNP